MPLFPLSENQRKIKERAEQFQQEQGQQAAPEEEGAEEGDITDYVLPIQGLGKRVLARAAEKGAEGFAKVAAKEAVKEGAEALEKKAATLTARDVAKEAAQEGKAQASGLLKKKLADGTIKGQQQKPEVEGPNYTGENIAFRPTKPGKQVGWENYEKIRTK